MITKKEAQLKYIEIIKKAKNENRKKLKLYDKNYEYRAWHHILPKSLYPLWSNRKIKTSNQVIVNIWEHAELHELAMIIWPGYKMLQAYLLLPKINLKYFSQLEFEKFFKNYYYEFLILSQRGNNKKKRKVICLETNEIFESQNEAARRTGNGKVTAVCNGSRLSSKGYHFQYYDEFLSGETPKCFSRKDNRKERMIKLNKEKNGCYHSNIKIYYNIDTNEIFFGGKELLQKYPKACKAKHCCRGTRNIAGGYHWRFATKEESLCEIEKRGINLKFKEKFIH